ncbi:Formate dehydrogenase H [Leclercia adecarboxylata]|uniref:Formate dehydrogenase H n=1 Tax=Leclercia adecarboxylata TaxID=83655 RepID=A0A4U9IDY9_9ENTR|nr:Formate dehydrogenase H [Leclercia adecarboxylata]
MVDLGPVTSWLTENLSPITKTPEYKYCAVRVEPIADQQGAEQYVIDEYHRLKKHLKELAKGNARHCKSSLPGLLFFACCRQEKRYLSDCGPH